MTDTVYDPAKMIAVATGALHKAIATTFDQMLGVQVVLEPAFDEQTVFEDGRTVAGVIGWAGDWRGIGMFSCKPECACKLADLMLGTTNPSLNEDSLDAVAEIANIIFGSVKTELDAAITAMSLGTPSVVYGSAHGVRRGNECFSVTPVRFENYLFYVKMHFVRAYERRSLVRRPFEQL